MKSFHLISKTILITILMLVAGLFFFKEANVVCAAKWGSCGLDNNHKVCPQNGASINACIDSVDISGYIYDGRNVPPGTKITMYAGNIEVCSDVTCLKRFDQKSTNWDGLPTSIIIDTIGCSAGNCRRNVGGKDGDWIYVLFTLDNAPAGCSVDMSANGASWFIPSTPSEPRGQIDITGGNNFSRSIDVKIVCPGAPTPTFTPIPTPTQTPTPTPIPTPTPTTPSSCPVPNTVQNVRINCPYCQ